MSLKVNNQTSNGKNINLVETAILILSGFQNIKVANTNDVSNTNIEHRIVDTQNKYPFVVVLEKQPTIFQGLEMRKKCSGSLIDDNWIITSAHCLDDDIKTIRYGNMTQDTNKTRTNVLLKIQHPLYKMTISKLYYHTINDIALIKVEKIPIKFGKIDPIHFLNLSNNEVVYADFERAYLESKLNGDINKTIDLLSKFENSDLRVYKGVVTDCKKEKTNVWYEAICVKTNRTTLQILRESSGGPLLLNGKIIGVNIGLLYDNVVRFTPISPYLEWIHEVITNVNQ